MKQKFKNYAFCFGVCVAIVGFIVAIGKAFNFQVNEVALTSVITAFLGVLVAMGIIEKEEEKAPNENDLQNEEIDECENLPFEDLENDEENQKNKEKLNSVLETEANDNN